MIVIEPIKGYFIKYKDCRVSLKISRQSNSQNILQPVSFLEINAFSCDSLTEIYFDRFDTRYMVESILKSLAAINSFKRCHL